MEPTTPVAPYESYPQNPQQSTSQSNPQGPYYESTPTPQWGDQGAPPPLPTSHNPYEGSEGGYGAPRQEDSYQGLAATGGNPASNEGPPQGAYALQEAYVAGPPPVYEPAVAGNGIPPPVAPGPGLPKNHPLNPHKDTKEAEQKAKIEAQKKKGFMGSIMGTITDVGNTIQKGVDSSLGYWDQVSFVRFQQQFPANVSEAFLGEYTATVVSANRSIDGKLYITSHSLAFVGRLEALKMIIPLKLIGSIQPVFCTVKHEGNHVKVPIFAAANPPTRPNALHIFTTDNRLHQIYSLSQFEYSYGTLDYAWRALGGGH